jgi:imidazolonepropionase-like amidohydrolase
MRRNSMWSPVWAVVALILAVSVAPAQEAENTVLITNVNVWDGTSDGLQNGMSVLVEGNLISQVAASISAPNGATVIDGGGRTLMPGLMDMHTHLTLKQGIPEMMSLWDGAATGAMAYETMQLYLRMGYTTLRDICGGSTGLARAIAMGKIDGPRLYSGGACLAGTSSHADWGNQNDYMGRPSAGELRDDVYIVNSPDQMRQAARQNFRNGATVLKIFVGGGVASLFDPLEATMLTAPEIRAAVEVAEDFGSYACMHAYQDASINRAFDAGVKCLEHGFLMSEETVKRMKAEGRVISLQSFMSYQAFLAPEEIQGFSAENIRKARQVNAGADQMFAWIAEHGVDAFAGTDMFTPDLIPMVTQDLVVRKRWFADVEILKHNTSNAGRWLGMTGPKNPYKEGPLGVIQPGAYADLILVQGDPTQDVAVLADYDANINFVMKDGKVFKNTMN